MSVYPDRLIIAFNSEGLHFLNEEREFLSSYGYADIYRWGGSSTQFSIIIWNAETQDTDDVAMLTTQVLASASCRAIFLMSLVIPGCRHGIVDSGLHQRDYGVNRCVTPHDSNRKQ